LVIAQDDPVNAVTNDSLVKVYDQCQLVTRRAQIRFSLCLMFWQHRLHSLKFNDQSPINPKVDSPFTDTLALIVN
jgi:hypothetical protein